MLEGVAYGQLLKLVSWLPGFLLRRFITKQWLASRVRIDVRPRHSPVQIMGGESPEATVWITIQNTGYFPIELDRFTVDLWLGGTSSNLFNLDRVPIPAEKAVELYVKGPVPPGHLTHYANNVKNNEGEVTVQVRAEFNSKIHNFAVNSGLLTGIKPRALNLPIVASRSVS